MPVGGQEATGGAVPRADGCGVRSGCLETGYTGWGESELGFDERSVRCGRQHSVQSEPPRLGGSAVRDKRVCVERLRDKRVCVDCLRDERVGGERLLDERVFVERVCDERVCVERLLDERLCVERLRDKSVCVERVCVERL
eukprot:1716897-Pleurochrysis_carterae.AAC.1